MSRLSRCGHWNCRVPRRNIHGDLRRGRVNAHLRECASVAGPPIGAGFSLVWALRRRDRTGVGTTEIGWLGFHMQIGFDAPGRYKTDEPNTMTKVGTMAVMMRRIPFAPCRV